MCIRDRVSTQSTGGFSLPMSGQDQPPPQPQVEDQGQRWAQQAAGSWPLPPGGWSVPSPGGAIAGSAQKVNPSPKRPYGQVQRIAEDQWRCPDGKTFPRAYLAYRHLKELKEKNPTILSPYKSPRTSTAERRALQQRAFVGAAASHGNPNDHLLQPSDSDHYQPMQTDDQKRCVVDLFGSRLDVNSLGCGESAYEMCCAWTLNDPHNTGTLKSEEAIVNRVELPPPLAHTAESMATDYGKKEKPTAAALDSILQSTPDTSPSVLLKMHKVYGKAIKKWWQARQRHRVNRYKKPRIDLILPHGIVLPTGEEPTATAID
eukprot:TRINITY_DN19374_c0_g1_i1.p1 TRINITY_DN19374_c0_g1~~TRINITY_DN19374_c0_g1_i1.p1  ORF type:complete len:317 (-),score=39.80 TRINITY_DN19374_c0_g1_i1:322-1272(-)